MSSKLDALFNEKNLSAREKVTKWVNIKEKLGARCGGFFLGFWEKPAEGKFKRAISIALEDFEDPKIVYGVTIPEYYEKEICRFMFRDEVGVEFYKIIPAKEKGMSDTKALHLINTTLTDRMGKGTATVQTAAAPSIGVAPGASVEEPTPAEDDDQPF